MELDPTVRKELIQKVSESINPNIRFRRYFKVTSWETTVRFSYLLKRTLDITLSIFAFVFFIPLLILTALCIWIENPGPVLYCQTRVGRNGKHFRLYKFRSMVVNADLLQADLESMNESSAGVIFKMKKDPRITRIGKVIRKLSIDELPQLLNVISGEMSLVGPRPSLPSEVAKYTLEERKRLDVIPGITCFWQVNGRSEISFNQQVMLDMQYIQSANFVTDILILLKTIPAVLTGKGAY